MADKNKSGNTENKNVKNDFVDERYACGYFSWKPHWLQRFNTPRFLLLCISWFTFTQGFVVNGIVYTNFTSWERRYGYSSNQLSWIASTYEIVAAVLTLIFGYIGPFVHNGIILSVGGFSIGIGSFIMALPHFLSGPYELGPLPVDFCDRSGNSTQTDCDDLIGSNSYYAYLLIAQCFHAVGGAAVYTLGIPYMDDQIKTKNTPMYIGIMQGMAAFGPSMGYILGGVFVSFYVDINRDIEVDITPIDPRWVGAWWIGLLYSGVAALSVGFFMGCFPNELPAKKKNQGRRKSEAYKGKGLDKSTEKSEMSFKDFWESTKNVFTNPIFICVTISGTVEAMGVAGFAAFLPKIIQFQFAQPPGIAAGLTGLVVIPGAVGGQLIGGIIPKCLNSKIRGLLAQSFLMSFCALLLSAQFLLRCADMPIAGVNVPYLDDNLTGVELTHPCNSDCNCTTASYDPTCGGDNIEYFSPCHAGCEFSYWREEDKVTIYYECSCVGMAEGDRPWEPTYGYSSTCQSECPEFGTFLILFFFMNLVTFISFTSGTSVTMRCVPDRYRAFGNGIQRFIARLLGEVPGVLLIGYVFDYTCVLFQDVCGEQGACWMYDTEFVAWYIFYASCGIKGISVLCFGIAWLVYKPPPDGVDEVEKHIKELPSLSGEIHEFEEFPEGRGESDHIESAVTGELPRDGDDNSYVNKGLELGERDYDNNSDTYDTIRDSDHGDSTISGSKGTEGVYCDIDTVTHL